MHHNRETQMLGAVNKGCHDRLVYCFSVSASRIQVEQRCNGRRKKSPHIKIVII